ncbi:LicD family protein [Thomasclavelia cocleata]|uniref:LicD family protein n=1 Tax=Thomasclavelia cocleata TaxID=69824 RepID=UPI00243099DC|nr:LicD family protein [Thomasclavelia cocleata]
MEKVDLLKKIELEIFIEFKKICDKNNLNYYICAGTLLGAVRHNGFIPWDDDIDILMLRDDYERFIKIAQNELPEYYFLQNVYTDPEFYFNFSKIRDNRTTFIETSSKNLNINHGVFIDIFPLDRFPRFCIDKIYIRLVERIANARISEYFENNNNNKSMKDFIIKKISYALFKTPKRAIFFKEKVYKKINKKRGDLLKNYSGAWGNKEIVSEDYFKDITILDFEGVQAKAPIYFDKYLTNLYGNYMKLPPIKEQVSHHYCETIDLEKSYKEYGY